jgi:hypothetical protein
MLDEFAPPLVAEAHQDIQSYLKVSHRADGLADCATSGRPCKGVAKWLYIFIGFVLVSTHVVIQLDHYVQEREVTAMNYSFSWS